MNEPQRTHYLGLTKQKKSQGTILWSVQLFVGIVWIFRAVEEPSALHWAFAIVMTVLSSIFLAMTFLGYSNNKLAPKLMIDDEEIIFKPRMNDQLIRIKWHDLRYLKVNKDQLFLQLIHLDKPIQYKTQGIFNAAAIADLKATAASKNIQFG